MDGAVPRRRLRLNAIPGCQIVNKEAAGLPGHQRDSPSVNWVVTQPGESCRVRASVYVCVGVVLRQRHLRLNCPPGTHNASGAGSGD